MGLASPPPRAKLTEPPPQQKEESPQAHLSVRALRKRLAENPRGRRQGRASGAGWRRSFGRRTPSDVGTLLSPLCFRRGVPMYYLRPTRFRLHAIIGAQRPLRQHKPPEPPPSPSLRSQPHAIVFPNAGKTILGIVFRSFPKNDGDPSMRTGQSRPESTNGRRFRQ